MMDRTQLILPFAQRDYIDMNHACRILGASWTTLTLLHKQGEIHIIDYRARAWKRVHYRSLVAFCDRLRARYLIPDRKPQLEAEFLRYRDEDVLPFPLRDTISMATALSALGYSRQSSVESLIDMGKIEAYKLLKGGHWRISASSLQKYLQQFEPREINSPTFTSL